MQEPVNIKTWPVFFTQTPCDHFLVPGFRTDEVAALVSRASWINVVTSNTRRALNLGGADNPSPESRVLSEGSHPGHPKLCQCLPVEYFVLWVRPGKNPPSPQLLLLRENPALSGWSTDRKADTTGRWFPRNYCQDWDRDGFSNEGLCHARGRAVLMFPAPSHGARPAGEEPGRRGWSSGEQVSTAPYLGQLLPVNLFRPQIHVWYLMRNSEWVAGFSLVCIEQTFAGYVSNLNILLKCDIPTFFTNVLLRNADHTV